MKTLVYSFKVLKKYLRLEELNKMSLAEIIEICRERNLPTDENKAQLISDLLFWVKRYLFNNGSVFIYLFWSRKIIQDLYLHLLHHNLALYQILGI